MVALPPDQLSWLAWTSRVTSWLLAVFGAVTGTLIEVDPAGINTVGGTVATEGLVLVRATVMPFIGAAKGMARFREAPVSSCRNVIVAGEKTNCGRLTLKATSLEAMKEP